MMCIQARLHPWWWQPHSHSSNLDNKIHFYVISVINYPWQFCITCNQIVGNSLAPPMCYYCKYLLYMTHDSCNCILHLWSFQCRLWPWNKGPILTYQGRLIYSHKCWKQNSFSGQKQRGQAGMGMKRPHGAVLKPLSHGIRRRNNGWIILSHTVCTYLIRKQ